VHTVFGKNDRTCFLNQKFLATAVWNLTQQNKFGFVDLDGYHIEMLQQEADARAFAAPHCVPWHCSDTAESIRPKWCKTASHRAIQMNLVAKNGTPSSGHLQIHTDTYEHSDL